ncbi:specifically androgen-regulated gene protein [Nematolebias whitei]|uniref:specifically androgen-regulated gene protein n=1 Tax=Nematolebias whitei TaxID=451745 RepID=UPI001899E184|nr:specifically androgen-regulated gene protein [Nematolebias whitei]
MPKNDIWPGDTGLETMDGMDSAGSCDSVVSANSVFSDDSLKHLSAEEKACLMFLEETIESLDTEEDSGLSNDESDQLPSPGNLTAKLDVDLSASLSNNKLNSSENSSKEPIKKNVNLKHLQSYLVPTPFVVASHSMCSVPSTKPMSLVEKTVHFESQFTSKVTKPAHKLQKNPSVPPVPLEVNTVILPSTKPKENSSQGPLPRGPLSYDALVHLRSTASTKKTPLCPKVDHTIDLNKHCSTPVEGPSLVNLPRSVKFPLEVHKSKTGPPAVAPKPKKIPVNIAMKLQHEGITAQDVSDSINHAKNPQVVRQEALQKLGLLKNQEQLSGKVGPPTPPKPPSSLDPVADRCARSLSQCNPMSKLSFTSSQALTEHKNENLQNTVDFHHHCRNDQESVSASHHPSQSSRLDSTRLEHSVSLDLCDNTNIPNYPEPQHIPTAKPMRTTTTAEPSSDKPSNLMGYSVMVVPGMGSDRKEALRKLGLLKN